MRAKKKTSKRTAKPARAVTGKSGGKANAGLRTVFSQAQIAKRVKELSRQIAKDFGEGDIHAIGILDNGFVFMADLVRNFAGSVICRFVKMEPIDTVVGTQEIRTISYGRLGDIEGKNVLVVAAMVDSGITVDYLVQQLLLQNPKTVRTVALIDRVDHRRIPFVVEYPGFSWDGGLLVGYGLGKDGCYRNLPYVATVTPRQPEPGNSKKGGAVIK
jgi:hypoxanthine phosphoribosyltransferase